MTDKLPLKDLRIGNYFKQGSLEKEDIALRIKSLSPNEIFALSILLDMDLKLFINGWITYSKICGFGITSEPILKEEINFKEFKKIFLNIDSL